MRARSVYPRRPLLIALALVAGVAVLPVLHPPLLLLWQIVGALVLALVLADRFLLRAQPVPQLRREVAPNLSLGAYQPVKISLRYTGRQQLRLQVFDHYPDGFDTQGMPARLTLDGRQGGQVVYKVRPRSRGDHVFQQIDLNSRSPFGFWSRTLRMALPEQVRVFPNFAELVHFTLLARRNQLSTAGVRRRQRRGEGSDFHQLREYREGDSLRQIDWKATGRYRRLISREYQNEQNQQLFFLLDCGQHMRHRDEHGGHLDAALNAMLLAAHIAIHQGDAVGYMTFAGSERYMQPRKGTSYLPALLRSAYDIHSSTRASDFLRMAENFMARQMQRALVVLITNTRDGDLSDLLLAVNLLQKRHLVLIADMRESMLDESLKQPIQSHDDALRFHTAAALRASRRSAHDALRHKGAVVVDIRPEQLPVALVNEYFEVKRSGRL